jgi:hypothetical protein
MILKIPDSQYRDIMKLQRQGEDAMKIIPVKTLKQAIAVSFNVN